MDTITNSYYYSQLPTTKIKTISIPKCVYRNVEAYRCNSYSYNQNNYSVKPSEIQSYSRQQSKLQTVFYHDFLATDAIPIDLLEATVKSDIIDNYEQLIKYSKRSLSLVSIDNSSTYSNSVGNSYSNSNDNTRVIHSVGNQLDHLRIDTLTSLITSNCDINYYNILNQTRYNNYPVDNSPTSYTINITNGAPIQQLLEVGHNYNSNTNILVATKKELYYVQAIDVRDSVIDRTEDDLKDSFRNRRTDKEIEKRKVLWKNKKLYPDSYNILDPLQKFLLPFDLVGVSNYYNSSYSIANCFCSNGNLYEWSPNSGVQLISSGSKFQDIQNNNNELIKNYLTYPKYMHLESTKHPCLTVVAINNNIYINDRRDNNINAPIRRNDTQFHCISQHPNDDNTIISCYNDKIVLIDKRLASRNISERFVPSSHDNISFVGNYNSNCGDSAGN